MNSEACDLVRALREQGRTIACAESLTAGLISAGIADVPGASAVLVGGAVTYATRAKASVLGVDTELLSKRGAVDPEVAQQMACGARRVFGADVGVSATGVAGPDGQDGKPVGLVYLGVCVGEHNEPDARCTVQEFHLSGDRAQIRGMATLEAWKLVLSQLTH